MADLGENKRLVEESITTQSTTRIISIERETTRSKNGRESEDFECNTSLNLKSKREEENAVLTALNRRFAVVVERNGALEKEVARLREQVGVAERTRVETIRQVTRVQGEETDLVRSDLAEERKARAEADAALEKAQEALEKATRLRNNALEKVESLEKEMGDLRGQLRREERKTVSLQEEFTSLEMTHEDLLRKLEEAEGKAREEFETRVDLEKTLERERGKWSVERQIIETDIVQRSSAYEASLEKVGEEKEKEYEAKLEKMLEVLRGEMGRKVGELKEALEKLGEAKVEEVESRWRSEVRREREEGKEVVRRLEEEKEGLEKEVEGLRRRVEEGRETLEKTVGEGREEVEEVRRQKRRLLEEWGSLLEAKTTLHSELSVYEILLQSEEARIERTDANNNGDATATPTD